MATSEPATSSRHTPPQVSPLHPKRRGGGTETVRRTTELEALGFYETGTAWEATVDGDTASTATPCPTATRLPTIPCASSGPTDFERAATRPTRGSSRSTIPDGGPISTE
jgi:hypothetical protein